MDFRNLSPTSPSTTSRRNYRSLKSEGMNDIPLYSFGRPNREGQYTAINREFDDDEPLAESHMDHLHGQPEFLHDVRSRGTQRSYIGSHSSSNHGAYEPVTNVIPRKPVATATLHQIDRKGTEQETVYDVKRIKPKKEASRNLFAIWFYETLCCILAMFALLAMIITVYAYNGQPLPNWRYGLGLGTLIAIYGIIFRAAAGYVLSAGLGQLKWTLFRAPQPLYEMHIYDEATRGPRGCIQLLAKFRGRPFIAQLGAITSLALLIIDPLAQQLIRIDNCHFDAKDEPTFLPRTQAYFGHGGERMWTGASPIEVGMQNAVNAGLFAPAQTAIKPDCPSGNCAYTPDFHTLGYCHACTDVSSRIVVSQNASGVTISLNTTYREIQISNGTWAWAMVGQREVEAQDSINSNFTFLIPGSETAKNFYDTQGTRAIQCNLYPCVRTMQSEVRNGTLNEVTLATYRNWNIDEGYWNNETFNMIDLDCLGIVGKQQLSNVGYHFTSTDKFIPYNGSILTNDTIVPGDSGMTSLNSPSDESHLSVPAKCIYTMSVTYLDGMRYFFSHYFEGQVAGPTMDQESSGPSNLYNLYKRGGTLDTFNEAISDIAVSITNYMRQTSLQNLSTPVIGTPQIQTTCAFARWQWISYIAFTAVTTLIFFISMICETGIGEDEWRHDFKASALASICAGLDEQTKQNLYASFQTGRSSELEASARNIHVQFLRHQGKFMHVD